MPIAYCLMLNAIFMPTNDSGQPLLSQVKDLLKSNKELMERIYESTEKTRKYVLWLKISSWMRLSLIIIFIVLPTVLAVIYLPPLLKDTAGQYQNLMKDLQTGNILKYQDIMKNMQSEDTLEQIKNFQAK